MHENAPSPFNLLPGGATHMHKIIPSAFYYLIYHCKTIRDIQFLLWQRWSFLTDKVLIFDTLRGVNNDPQQFNQSTLQAFGFIHGTQKETTC